MLHGKERTGRQRLRCRSADCRRTFNVLADTAMAPARRPKAWGHYLSYVTDHLSMRKIMAERIGLNHVTVWRWRHRFLKAAATDNSAVLSGTIEADETFFVSSFKGDRGWVNGRPPENRTARPSAWSATKRGVSSDQVPVLTALDDAGEEHEVVLPSMTAIEAALDGRIARGSVICPDGALDYLKAAVKAGAEHRRVVVQTIVPTAVEAYPCT